MSVSYPADPTKPYGDRLEVPRLDPQTELARDEAPFVPVYARRGKARGDQGKIKTWMILVPVGAIVLAGIGAMLVMTGGEEASVPLAEPAATAPVLPLTPAPTAAAAPVTTMATPAPAPVVAAPIERDAAPLRRVAPAPARRETVRTPAATPRAVTPAPAPVATGPQAYTPAPAAPSAAVRSTAPATPAPSPPVIVVQPMN